MISNEETFSFLASRLISSLSLKGTEIEKSVANETLDRLNALDYRSQVVFNNKEAEALMCQCFVSITPSDTFLVAKCCHLILNFVRKQGLEFDVRTIDAFVAWVSQALKFSADVIFLDILQAVDMMVRSHPKQFEKSGKKLYYDLLGEPENRSSLSDPSDIKIWRLRCLHSLSLVLPLDLIPNCVSELIKILNSQSTEDFLSHAQVWRHVMEALDGLCCRSQTWLNDLLPDVLGVIFAAIHVGLRGIKPSLPKQLNQSVSIIQEPHQSKDSGSKVNVRGKQRQKTKVKQVGWSQNEQSKDCEDVDKPVLRLEQYNTNWLTSDSDFSDGEGGQTARLLKEQARARHAALNLLIQVVKVHGSKQLYGYYGILLGPGGLLFSVRNETSLKPRIASLAAITGLLFCSKNFLAQAQHSEGGSFTSFSGVLSELLTSTHLCLITVLNASPSLQLSVPLLHCTSTLISVSPYHRLKPSILTDIFRAVLPFLSHKDPTVCVGALQCLTEIVTAVPVTSEHKSIITIGASADSSQDKNWMVSLCLHNLEIGGGNETVQVGWWQLITGICRCHFSEIVPSLTQLESILLRDLASPLKLIQLYAARTLEHFTAQIVLREDLRKFYAGLWLKCLEGPLVPILQSTLAVASVGCDCLGNIGPIVYTALREELQILVITLLYGCSSHEEGAVRASAVRTLGMFLLFPQVVQEQFVCDINEIVIKALSDPVISVRIKAAWAFGNLAQILSNHKDQEFFGMMSLIGLLDASLSVANDGHKVKANMLRAVGTLLQLVTEDNLKETHYRETVDKAALFLLQCATSGSMKMRWNACYAIGSLLRNDNIQKYSSNWQNNIISGLCGLVVKCTNFKVRSNACMALSAISKRAYYGSLYHIVWLALIDGLDNAVNMPDFKEFKHRDSLLQQLCATLCHIAAQLESEDLSELEDILAYRIDSLHQHLCDFQEQAPPEKSGSVLTVANHLQQLAKSNLTSIQKESLSSLQQIFRLKT